MFRQTDPDLGKFLLRTLTLTLCACLLSISVIGVLANLVPMYAASGPQIPLLQPLDETPTANPTATEPPTMTPSPTVPPMTPSPSPTSAPTAQPTKTSTPAPAPTRPVAPTALPTATAAATALVTATPTATAKATATSRATASPTASPTLSNNSGSGGQQSNNSNTAATTRIAQSNNLSFLPVITGAVLMLLALILVGVLLLRHYIAPEPLPRTRLASGARPWRRTRSAESLAGDRDLAGNPLPLEGSPSSLMLNNSWQPSAAGAAASQQPPLHLGPTASPSETFAAAPTQMQPAAPLTTPSPLPGPLAHELPLVPTGLTVTPGSSASSQHRQTSLSSGALEDTARRPATARPTGGGPASSSRLKRNFLFPTTSLMPTTGELPVASNLAFPPHGTSPFNGNFLFPTTSLVPAEGMPSAPGSGLQDTPPQLSPQPEMSGPSSSLSATSERQTEPGASALPPWLANLTANGPSNESGEKGKGQQ